MKSKAVASFLPHVASKIPSVSGGGCAESADTGAKKIPQALPLARRRKAKGSKESQQGGAAAHGGEGGDAVGVKVVMMFQ